MLNILFVCAGNTCRSPMAEAIFNKLAKDEGVDAKAFSAGAYGIDGVPYSEETVRVLEENGIILSGTSKELSKDDVEKADFVFGLTSRLASEVAFALPQYSEKVMAFSKEIPDPFGRGIEAYRECYKKLYEQIKDMICKIKEMPENEN